MREIILVRHGEVEGFTDDIMYGWTDLPLNEKGVKQTLLAGELLKEERFDHIACSPLLRAKQTLENIRSVAQKPKWPEANYDERLREIGLGELEMSSKASMQEKYPLLVKQFETDWQKAQYPGGESIAEFAGRARDYVDEEILGRKHQRTLIVAHSALNRMLMLHLLRFNPDLFWQLHIDFAGIVRIRLADDGCASLMSLNGG